jgi:hypothetical protein
MALQMREANAAVKFTGATIFGRTGIQVGTASQFAGFMLSKSDLAKVLIDPEAGWLAAKLVKTPVKSPDYPTRIRRFMQALARLGVYAKSGDTIIQFTKDGYPEPVLDY